MRYLSRVLSLVTIGLAGCGESQSTVWDLPSSSPVAVKSDEIVLDTAVANATATNLGDLIPPGYRGLVHPLLAKNQGTTSVFAYWSPIGTGRAAQLGYFPRRFYEPYENLSPDKVCWNYTARDLSQLLPHELEEVGQVWSMDEVAVTRLLRQFHPTGSMRLKAPGRRAGPNGAFGIVRAISPTHLDIRFRVHGEFQPAPETYITPSHFAGRMVIARETGAVPYFRMALPSDQLLNVTLTRLHESEALIDLVTVERMELLAGKADEIESLEWAESMEASEAEQRLKEIFYKFVEINWVDPADAVQKARESHRPILAVVLWGSLDEQSC